MAYIWNEIKNVDADKSSKTKGTIRHVGNFLLFRPVVLRAYGNGKHDICHASRVGAQKYRIDYQEAAGRDRQPMHQRQSAAGHIRRWRCISSVHHLECRSTHVGAMRTCERNKCNAVFFWRSSMRHACCSRVHTGPTKKRFVTSIKTVLPRRLVGDLPLGFPRRKRGVRPVSAGRMRGLKAMKRI
jgi:hypothetical protein